MAKGNITVDEMKASEQEVFKKVVLQSLVSKQIEFNSMF